MAKKVRKVVIPAAGRQWASLATSYHQILIDYKEIFDG